MASQVPRQLSQPSPLYVWFWCIPVTIANLLPSKKDSTLTSLRFSLKLLTFYNVLRWAKSTNVVVAE